MKWERHVARMGESRGACRVLVGSSGSNRPLKDLSVYRWIILQWIFKNWDEGMDWFKKRTGGGLF
jgi:hypothetical protein